MVTETDVVRQVAVGTQWFDGKKLWVWTGSEWIVSFVGDRRMIREPSP